jgi:hypothetical protein
MRNDYKGESTLSISAKQLAEIVGAAVASAMAQPQKRERWIPAPGPIGPYSESYPDSVLYAPEDDVRRSSSDSASSSTRGPKGMVAKAPTLAKRFCLIKVWLSWCSKRQRED